MTPLYIPSFYGDIRLEVVGDGETKLVAEKLSDNERKVLQELGVAAIKKKWTDKALGEGSFFLNAPILKVQRALTKLMKPGRTVLTAVRFANGQMEEVHEAENKLPVATAAAVAVAKPTQGCPAPDFVRADIKARAVLDEFLTDEQRDDFRRHNAFVSVGARTGHRYMVISRHARQMLAAYGGRSLFDLDERESYCVHDWSVPAAEEVLAIHVMLQMPRHEDYLRFLERGH